MSFSQRMLQGRYTKENFESKFQKDLAMIVTALSLSPDTLNKEFEYKNNELKDIILQKSSLNVILKGDLLFMYHYFLLRLNYENAEENKKDFLLFGVQRQRDALVRYIDKIIKQEKKESEEPSVNIALKIEMAVIKFGSFISNKNENIQERLKECFFKLLQHKIDNSESKAQKNPDNKIGPHTKETKMSPAMSSKPQSFQFFSNKTPQSPKKLSASFWSLFFVTFKYLAWNHLWSYLIPIMGFTDLKEEQEKNRKRFTPR